MKSRLDNKLNYIRKIAVIGLSIFLFSFSSQEEQFPIKNISFKKGEKLTYRLHYGLLTGGYPVLQIGDKDYTVNGKPCYRIEVSGKSAGLVHKMFKINDLWRSYVDTSSMLPQYAFRNINENNYKLQEDTYLNRGKSKVQVDKHKKDGKETKYYDAPEGIHDIVSGFFYYRNVDWSAKKSGDIVSIKSFFEDELYDIKVEYKGVFELKTDLGKINCYKLQPKVPNNSMFDGEDSILFYLSADKNRIPVKIKANMFVGSVEMDILKYEGLRHSIKFK